MGVNKEKSTNLRFLEKALKYFTRIRLCKIVLIAVLIDSLIYFFWFLRIKFLTRITFLNDPFLRAFQTLFNGLNLSTLLTSLELWIADLVALFVPVLIISLLTKLISKILGKKLSFSTFFAISIFATIPYLISVIIYYVLTILNLAEYQFIFTWTSYLVLLLLIIYGVVITPSPKIKRFENSH